MRMRKLGKGQSLVFCITEEIRHKIIELTNKADASRLEVADVLSWAISETFGDLRRSLPIWATQGRRYIEQRKIWNEAESENGWRSLMSKAPLLLEPEAQTLEHRYKPTTNKPTSNSRDTSNKSLEQIHERCREFDSVNFDSASLQEEQERELSPEKESERQVEKPAPARANPHYIHPDLKAFVSTGRLKRSSPAFIPAFQSLRNSTAAECFDVSQFPQDLLVTVDFSKTVQIITTEFISDFYQQPVQWILTSTGDSANMIIISPFEAQKLRGEIKEQKRVMMHLYSPRSNIKYYSLDALNLFTEGASFEVTRIPQYLTIQLNLFAGQLYFDTYKEYTEYCDFLSLAWIALEDDSTKVQSDGFILSGKTFKKSPVQFFKILMSKIRRNCQAIDKTHLGKVLEGQLLEALEFTTQ
jgi:hypothetical protein